MIEVTPKKLEDFETLKESAIEVRLLVEIYERRIAELNAIIEKLLVPREVMVPPPHLTRIGPDPKSRITTTSQLIAAMEKKSKIGEAK